MSLPISIHNQSFILDGSGAIFWKEKSMLLIADVHLGKVAHFRKHGAAVPLAAGYKNLEKLTEVVNNYQPQTVCFLGDLFHSALNNDWEEFIAWIGYTHAKVLLVSGNHDIIPQYLFEEKGIAVVEELIIDSFYLTHHPTEKEGLFNFCGHIHPGVFLKGSGKQRLKLACFFKTASQLILPAFGSFTGKYVLQPTEKDAVFVLAEGEVVAL